MERGSAPPRPLPRASAPYLDTRVGRAWRPRRWARHAAPVPRARAFPCENAAMQTSFPRVAWIACAALLASGCAVTGEQQRKPGFIGVHDGPVFDARVTFAGGEYGHDIEHSLDDQTSAGFVGILAEASNHSGYGGGISLEALS